jgi:phage tail-like protein
MSLIKRDNPDYVYQTVNFLFSVVFSSNGNAFDIRFQSVTGLDATLETETIKEGGENRFEHVIPVRRKYGPLVLKRGVLAYNESDITKWLKMIFDEGFDYIEDLSKPPEERANENNIRTIDTVQIQLLNEAHQPLMTWTVNNVWPRSWKIGELNAERGEVLIETMELNYNYLILAQ